MKTKITQDMIPAFQGVIPPTLATSSPEGIPNITYISHVHYVDEEHLALSRQFFNKTWKNISQNPVFAVAVTCPKSFTVWKINLRYEEERTEGEVFDEMDMIITAMATMLDMEDVFKLKSAVMCKVESIQTIVLNGKLS